MSYYRPPALFRQNAVKRTVSDPELSYRTTSRHAESWLYDYENSNSHIIGKTTNTNKMKIASNYWKIPDDELYLTSVAINKGNQEQLAISSGMKQENLFIYNLNYDDMVLTHQQTITLPFIEKLKWCTYDTEESSLLTGHKNGSLHLVSVPNVDGENAKILKRFNHKKHFNKIRDLSIKQINSSMWTTNSSNILTLCNENIFLWDLQNRSDVPILKNQNLGILNFDASYQHGVLALAGEFGIALNDLRVNNTSASIFQPSNGFELSANNVKWAPYDSNVIAASHLDGTVRLWDIRAQGYFGKLSGHNDLMTSLEWSEESSSDLYTGSKDGNIIHWDLNFSEDLSNCCLNGGLDSISYHKKRFLSEEWDIYNMVHKRQCGTLIPAASDSVIELTSTSDMILSIDGSSFLGVHGKRGVDAFKVEEGTSSMIMDELLSELPALERKDFSASESESEEEAELFDPASSPVSPACTFIASPREISHSKQRSITNFNNGSENSLNTLIDLSPPSVYLAKDRRDSASTLNDEETEGKAAFTYQRVLPLKQRVYDGFASLHQQQQHQPI